MSTAIEKNNTVGEKIKRIRNSKNLTQQSFAELLNTSVSFVSEIERGIKKPGYNFLLSLKNVFNINLNWLFIGKGDLFTEELTPINSELLKNIIEKVEEISVRKKLSLQPPKKAQLIVFLFEELLENETKIQNLEERVLKLMKLFSEL